MRDREGRQERKVKQRSSKFSPYNVKEVLDYSNGDADDDDDDYGDDDDDDGGDDGDGCWGGQTAGEARSQVGSGRVPALSSDDDDVKLAIHHSVQCSI